MDKIRILIVDDEPLPRKGIRLLLKDDPEIEILAECATGMEALNIIHTVTRSALSRCTDARNEWV
jgi:two-component system LytT family response regulator